MSEDRKEAQGRKPWLKRLAEGLMVLALAGMVVAVFVNVVLRYVFHTSIVSYEEISRLLFVWLVAIGAIVAALKAPIWASTW
jgi:TRAP-type C4-dicarboxylate transport system permease small subunit